VLCTRLAVRRVLVLLGGLAALAAAAGRAHGADDALDPSRFHGQVVLVDFWASWCGPCRQSFPWMSEMKAKYGERGLVVVAVDIDEDPAAGDRFLAAMPAVDFVQVRDPKGSSAEAYGVKVMPSSILFDREGRPVYRHEGFRTESEAGYERDVVALLEGRGPKAALAIAPAARRRAGVAPWRRGALADPAMTFGSDALESELDDHIYFSKEASSGGRGFGGGGCGCN
jgi:thiol-disulfide isomerase/thioredoxin